MRAYGEEDEHYFRILLWLLELKTWLVTNIYVREDTGTTAMQRIWHLCRACKTSEKGFYKRLSEFTGKQIRVTLTTVTPPRRCRYNEPYSDVDKFLTPESTGPEGDSEADVV